MGDFVGCTDPGIQVPNSGGACPSSPLTTSGTLTTLYSGVGSPGASQSFTINACGLRAGDPIRIMASTISGFDISVSSDNNTFSTDLFTVVMLTEGRVVTEDELK